MTAEYDVGIAGAGIVGLAHAYHLAKRGLRVVVFERGAKAQGASVRNFGMIWPVGQPLGSRYDLALGSRQHWLEVLGGSGIWHKQCGSLHLAYHDDEAEVLREFVAESAGTNRLVELWTPAQVAARFPAVVQSGLRAALWSPTELAVDPREVIGQLPVWLARTYGVQFRFGTPVLGYDETHVVTPDGDHRVRRLLICTGIDFRELAPRAFADNGLVPCKLQMMRSQAFGTHFRLGSHLAAGLTLRHYASFAHCPTLPKLVKRLDEQYPEHVRYGIHVLVSQNGIGELTIGDSHEYGDAVQPFDNVHIDQLILDYLRTFLIVPDLRIVSRWHGVYLKHPTEPYVVARLGSNVLVVTGTGGMGMTLSFGLAEQVITEWLGELS
jgi:FAD dependent oxidoreductase TIGR03364